MAHAQVLLDKPLPLPSDAGNLNWITGHLRQNIGRELGITDYGEGTQVLFIVFCVLTFPAESELPSALDMLPQYNIMMSTLR